MASFPDYYSLLNITSTASSDEVRSAYKKESLKCHPDRLANASPAEKKKTTEKFQAVADAYYVLSDGARRREYDALRSSRRPQEQTTDPSASGNFFANFASMFGGATPGGQSASNTSSNQRPEAEDVFGDVFEDLLRPEVERSAPFWAWLGAVCGAGLGFIFANFPGLFVGGFAGNRLGAIRDAKGKPVATVFAQLGGSQKAEILRALAIKVLGSAGL